MSSKSERERLIVIGSGSPLAKHSMNQGATKRSLQGERRLGIFPARVESQITKLLNELGSDEDFSDFFKRAQVFSEKGLVIPIRVGQLSLRVSSLVNQRLKEDIEGFVEHSQDFPHFKFLQGSQFDFLIPQQLMVLNYLRDTGQLPPHPKTIRYVQKSAKVFAYNYGGFNFTESEQLTALSAMIVFGNIARYIGREISKNRISELHARRMVMVFGETTNRHLQTLKPKKNFRAKRRR